MVRSHLYPVSVAIIRQHVSPTARCKSLTNLTASVHRHSWHGLTTRGTDLPLPFFSNFLFTNLFSITFLYFFIISSLFPYFNLFVSIFIQSYVNIKLYVSTLYIFYVFIEIFSFFIACEMLQFCISDLYQTWPHDSPVEGEKPYLFWGHQVKVTVTINIIFDNRVVSAP